jgi:putative Mn2+ efflux pump MntP
MKKEAIVGVITWAEQRTQSLNICDIGILKVYCVLFGMIVGAYVASFVKDQLWWFVGAVLVLGGYLGFKWFTAGPR